MGHDLTSLLGNFIDWKDFEKFVAEMYKNSAEVSVQHDVTLIGKIDVLTWMSGSRFLLSEVYNFKTNIINQEYINSSAVIIKKQFVIASL